MGNIPYNPGDRVRAVIGIYCGIKPEPPPDMGCWQNQPWVLAQLASLSASQDLPFLNQQ